MWMNTVAGCAVLHELRVVYADDFYKITAALYDSNVRGIDIRCQNAGVCLSHSEELPESDEGIHSNQFKTKCMDGKAPTVRFE